MTKQVTNKSGITPSGNRVIIKPDEIEKVTPGGIVIPETEADKHALAQAVGTLIAVGPDAFGHLTTVTERLIDGQWKVIERTRSGYSTPFAEVGDKVMFAKFAGQRVEGEDDERYVVCNDEDITATVSEGVNLTDIKSRTRVGAERSQG